MRILWLPHSANPAYAGVRLRCLLPAAGLRRSGHEVVVARLAEDRAAHAAVVQGKWLLDCQTPAEMHDRTQQLERLRERGCRLILDCFDNYFLNEQGDPARDALLQRFRSTLPLFAGFVVSSPGLLPSMRTEVGASASLRVVGDPLEGPGANRWYEEPWRFAGPQRWPGAWRAACANTLLRWDARSARQVLWFGNHGSQYAQGGMAELGRIVEALRNASRRVPLRLTVASNSRPRYAEVLADAGFSHRYVEWDRLHFASMLQRHDLVVLPTALTPFTTAKSNNRLLLPLWLGVPVVADAVPDYLPWRDHFQLGGWEDLAATLEDLSALKAKARAAREVIADQFSVPAIAGQWLSVLAEATRPDAR